MSDYDMELERQRRRERERAAIRREIDSLQRKIDYASEIIIDLTSCISAIRESLDGWGTAYMTYIGNEMASVVMVPDRFEGCIAEKMASEIPAALKGMETTKAKMENVKSGISSQIVKLHKYIDDLRARITALWSKFHSI